MENNIILEFIQLNMDIEDYKIKSKLPKFLKNIRYKIYKKKMYRSASKLKKANVPLTKYQLETFFTYIFNNFAPDTKYNSIEYVKIKDNLISTKIVDTKKQYTISIFSNTSEKKFEIRINNPNSTGADIHLKSLTSNNELIKEDIYYINNHIWGLISDYIIDTIVPELKEK